jgi:hypothetical protein
MVGTRHSSVACLCTERWHGERGHVGEMGFWRDDPWAGIFARWRRDRCGRWEASQHCHGTCRPVWVNRARSESSSRVSAPYCCCRRFAERSSHCGSLAPSWYCASRPRGRSGTQKGLRNGRPDRHAQFARKQVRRYRWTAVGWQRMADMTAAVRNGSM